MTKIMAIIFAGLALVGCATTSSNYGNFLSPNTELMIQNKLADDAIMQLAALYPPAKVQFELHQPTPDLFGTALVQKLRENGYAIQEYTPKVAVQNALPEQVTPHNDATPLRYVVDWAEGLYRVTLSVGSESLTRAYLSQDGTVQPASYWIRKEK